MNPEPFTLDQTLKKRNLRSDYLEGEASLQPFYQYPIQETDFNQIIQDKKFSPHNREVLCQALEDQYEGMPVTAATRHNLDLLRKENTYTLTTGHQLNLFGGPLYTPYKVLTVITLARQLNEQFPDYNFVPVFWIHTEDHDYLEINHYYPTYTQKVTYPAPFAAATGPHCLTNEITELIPAHYPQELKDAYQPGRNLGEASFRFHNQLFGSEGLVILDAMAPQLKALFKEVLRSELFKQESHQIINQTSQAMWDSGYAPQISPREINLFYLDDQGRDRIVGQGEGFAALNRDLHWSKAEMQELIEQHPERFSPNVSLRPLYQEQILPNLAYCGGWAEVGYWMQLKDMFGHFDTNFPLLLPRMSATLFRKSEWDEWHELGFKTEEIQKKTFALYREYMPKVWESNEFEDLSKDLLKAFDNLYNYIDEQVSTTLPRSVEGQKVKTQHFLQNTLKKIHRVIRNDQRAPFEEISTLKSTIQPDGLVQERLLGLGSFPDYSPYSLVQQMLSACHPLDFQHHYICLTED